MGRVPKKRCLPLLNIFNLGAEACMQDTFARARARPKGRQAKRVRDDRVYCIQSGSICTQELIFSPTRLAQPISTRVQFERARCIQLINNFSLTVVYKIPLLARAPGLRLVRLNYATTRPSACTTIRYLVYKRQCCM